MPTTDEPRTLTKSEAAALLKVSEKTVERYIDRGRLRSFQAASGRILLLVEDVERLARPEPVAPKAG